MANINLTGILRDPTGEFSYRNKIRFTHNTTTGQTLAGFRSVHDIAINGSYDIDVEYGNVSIDTFDCLNQQWIHHGMFTINSDTPASDIPTLLGITTPATDADLLVFQALAADAANSASLVSSSISSKEVESTEYLINSFYPSSLVVGDIVKTLGYYTKGDGGGASWVLTSNTGSPSQSPSDLVGAILNDLTGAQWALLGDKSFDAVVLGVSPFSLDNGPAMRACFSEQRSVYFGVGLFQVYGPINIYFGSTMRTAGWNTEFSFSGMTDTTDCFNIIRKGSFDRKRDIHIGRHGLTLLDSNARYGWSTPYDANVFTYEQPHVEIYCKTFAPNRATTVMPYSFLSAVRVGDCRSGRVELYGSGGYSTTEGTTGQRQSDGITLVGETGNVGVKMKVEYVSVRKGLNILDGVEGFQIEGEFVSCIIGIDSDEQTTVEPGGFIDNMHVNARDVGYRLKNRSQMSIGQASAYKSDGFYNDGSSTWTGFEMDTGTSVIMGDLFCGPGSTFTPRSRNTAISFKSGSYESKFGHLDARNCGLLVSIADANAITCGSSHSVNGLVGYQITGTVTNIDIGKIRERGGDLISTYISMGAGVSKSNVRYNQKELQKLAYKSTTVSAAGTSTINPIVSPINNNFVISAGTGAYTYDIELDDTGNAVEGSEIELKINMPSSANAMVRVKAKTSGTVLSTINTASSKRIIGRYLFTGSAFVELSMFESIELTY